MKKKTEFIKFIQISLWVKLKSFTIIFIEFNVTRKIKTSQNAHKASNKCMDIGKCIPNR
jgi:hypothetical protein